MKSPKSGKKPLFGRVIDLTLLSLFAVLIIWLAVVGIKISSGVAKTVPVPSHTVRLELIDAGCGREGLNELKKLLNGYSDSKIEIDVISESVFKRENVAKSFLINRSDLSLPAMRVAELLGLNEDEIVNKKMEMNKAHITVSLVAGEDVSDKLVHHLKERIETKTID